MNKGTEYKLNRAKLSFRKNYLSKGLSVKNVLLIGSTAAMAVLGICSCKVAADGISKDMDKKAAFQLAEIKGTVIELDESSSLDADLMEKRLRSIDEAAVLNKEGNRLDALASAETEFTTLEQAVNIRKDESTESEILGHLYRGMTGSVESTENGWAKIKSGDIEGYVAADYISVDSDEYKLTNTALITKDDTNIRVEGSEDADVLCTAACGEEYPIDTEESTDEWGCVTLPNGTQAYINMDYVEITENDAVAVTDKDFYDFSDRIKVFAASAVAEVTEAPAPVQESTTQATEAPAQTTQTETAAQQQTTEAKKSSSSTKKTGSTQTVQTTTEKKTEAEQTTTEEQQTTTEEPTTQAQAAAQSDVELLYAIVYAEAGGESYEGQLATANVVLNRCKSGRWGGTTISDVVYAPGQFAAIHTSRFTGAFGGNVPALTKQACNDALNGVNNIGNCQSFRIAGYANGTVIGNQVFF